MEPTPEVVNSADATADFYQALNDPKRWIIKPGVPVFKSHERVDPATGKLIQVDVTKLYRIAENMQKLERQGGVPIRMTLGHTEPGKPETMQPPIGGYYRNARVATFGPKAEPAIVVDEWLDPQYSKVRKNFPYRSAEYYDDSEQITGVALLTRDPYLDLGVVAYTRASRGAVHYSRLEENRRPTMYHFLTGETTMNPDGTTPAPAAAATPVTNLPPQPITAVPQNPTPAPTTQPQVRQPQQYAGGAVPTDYRTRSPYSAPWPGPAYRKHNIGHSHPSGGAVYAAPGGNPVYGRPGYGQQPGQYADEDIIEEEPGGAGPPPPGDMGPGTEPPPENELQVVHRCLTEAVEALSAMLGGAGGAPSSVPEGGPPQTPFPEEPPEQNARYRNQGPPRPYRTKGPPGRYRQGYPAGYSAAGAAPQARRPATNAPQPGQAPQPPREGTVRYNRPGEPMRTISGYPVGYQMEIETLKYQNRQLNDALRVLFYERDQSDTEWCASEIRRLASQGYQVGDYEFAELKSKPRDQRELYLQHIVTRYQRIGIEAPPPILGDPTPGQEYADNRPASRDEMEAALRLMDRNGITDYSVALQYARRGAPVTGPAVNQPTPEQPMAHGDQYLTPGTNGTGW